MRYGGSTERPWLVLDLVDRMSPSVFWRVIHREWCGFDRIPHQQYAVCFSMFRPYWQAEFMLTEDAAQYEKLPDEIRIYRGQSIADPIGLSWTLEKTVAECFARGHRGLLVSNPVILEATVAKTDVAGFYQERQESEIVLFAAPQMTAYNVFVRKPNMN